MTTYHVSRETRERIRTAAGELFAAHGFDGTSTRAIAERAGVKLGSLHYHFGSKEELYLETYRSVCRLGADDEREWERVYADYADRLDDPTAAAELVRRLVDLAFEHFPLEEGAPWELQLIMREVTTPSSAHQLVLDQLFRRRHDIWLAVHRAVLPEAPVERAHVWACENECLQVFFLNVRDTIGQLVGPDYEPVAFGEAIKRHAVRAMILTLGLPLPEDLR